VKTRLKVAWKTAVALAMCWVAGETFGVDFSALPFWRQAAGFTVLMVAFAYITEAVEAEDQHDA
jgi:hypothetical protein